MNEKSILIFDFLKKFYSFESALRITNSVGIKDNATIEWNDVKENLKKKNFTLSDERSKLEIIQCPPKKLIFSKNKGLAWELGEIGSNSHDLAVNVLVRVRNNLFHGSKKFGDSSEGDRNVTLISEALIILDDVVKSLEIEDVYKDVVEYWN
jgi:hypothetical protein